MISALYKALWSSESAVDVEIGDPYMSEMPLDSSAWAPSSTVKSYINSANKVSPYFNTKYYCAKKIPNKKLHWNCAWYLFTSMLLIQFWK